MPPHGEEPEKATASAMGDSPEGIVAEKAAAPASDKSSTKKRHLPDDIVERVGEDGKKNKNEPEGRYLFECSRSQCEQLGLFTISSCRQRWHYEIAEAKESRRKLNITKTKLPSHQRGKSFESSSCANSENDYKSELCFAVIRNDGTPKNMERLITLKNIFSKQLPKMPKEYIVRLVMDRRHFSMALLKVSLSA